MGVRPKRFSNHWTVYKGMVITTLLKNVIDWSHNIWNVMVEIIEIFQMVFSTHCLTMKPLNNTDWMITKYIWKEFLPHIFWKNPINPNNLNNPIKIKKIMIFDFY